MPDVAGANIWVPAELEAAGAYINNVAAQIDSELVALKAKLIPLDETWTGVTRIHYYDLQHEWDVAADALMGPQGVLGVIAQSMNLNWNNYTDCEWSNAKTWSR